MTSLCIDLLYHLTFTVVCGLLGTSVKINNRLSCNECAMKFSIRVSVAAATVLVLLSVYIIWHRFRPGRVLADEKHAVYGEIKELTTHKQYLYSLVTPSVSFLPQTTVIRPQSNSTLRTTHSDLIGESLVAVHHSSADIRTLDILDAIDRERRFGVLTKETTTPSSEELSGGLPLQVIVVPHSHNDPGWLNTVDSYFQEQTKHTLDYMLDKLQLYRNMTFVWAESVFLSMWWSELSDDKRLAVKQLLKRGQLEIVGGSWVVPDEANPHYFALIDQMIEGHQWLKHNVAFSPSNTWSLDPFGYSAVQAHLYKLAGFENMVILRAHTAVKQYLQSRHSLEFMWRTMWNSTEANEIVTLMMPYMLYSIKHTCGPDPKVCVQFDFRKITGEMSESRAVTVHSGNVDRLSKLLLRQYQLKARLFHHNVVLVPLGDDFRYDRNIEWDQQFKNYMRLFDHMNSMSQWNVHARFGTVKDYFREVKTAMTKLGEREQSAGEFLSLAGDFFPYTDHSDEFWTGYFSTRPFAKGLCRDLEVYLRSAEILHSLAVSLDAEGLYQHVVNTDNLVNSRRRLALFQHHDGITGTSRFYVAADYESRLEQGLQMSKDVMRSAFGFLLSNKSSTDQPVNVLDPLSAHTLSPNEHVIHVSRVGVRLQVFNNIAHKRHELIHLIVNHQRVRVVNHEGLPLVSQITPYPAENSDEEEMASYLLSFIADLPPLSITAFDILPAGDSCRFGCSKTANTTTHTVSRLTQQRDIVFENNYLKAAFSLRSGLLKMVQLKGKNRFMHSSLQFLFYTSRRSGAYIFGPAGPAEDHIDKQKSLLKVFSGPLFTEVRLTRSFVTHWARIVHCDCPLASAVELNTVVDLSAMDDRELVLRLNSDVRSGNIFYTDQNGFQMMKRQRFSTFPIEANYYPATSAVFIEDDELRLSLLMSQPSGVSSQTEGSLEVMLDRRLQYDDNRGLSEGVLDNKPVFFRHYLLLESAVPNSPPTSKIMRMPTLLAHTIIHRMRNQPVLMLSPLTNTRPHPLLLLKANVSCDTVLVNLKALNDTKTFALILHRVGHYTGYSFHNSDRLLECSIRFQPLNLSSMFTDIKFQQVVEKTLSLMHSKGRQDKNKMLHLHPMQLRTFELGF